MQKPQLNVVVSRSTAEAVEGIQLY